MNDSSSRPETATEEGSRFWVSPEDYIDSDIEEGRLLSLKGITPVELPGLDTNE